MSAYDWSKFSLKVNINAPVAAIYDAWTIPERLEDWFLRRATFSRNADSPRERFLHIQKGDTYVWNWHGHPDEIMEKGEVLLANEADKLQFSFTAGGIVTVDIGEALGETIVMLTQEKIPTDEKGKVSYHMGCMTGWTFYLANLKSYMEGGVDLRNKNLNFTNMINS
jgi:uncharacterized protein YndB with AHSA1/START domain